LLDCLLFDKQISVSFYYLYIWVFLRAGIKLTEDMVKVSIMMSDQTTTEEFHMYPTRKELPRETRTEQDASRLNIVFILIDSVSNSCAKRYLKKFVKRMNENPNSIIMKVSLDEKFGM